MKVTTAWRWPSDTQFQTADVIVAFCYLRWNDDRLVQVRRFLENGGGLAEMWNHSTGQTSGVSVVSRRSNCSSVTALFRATVAEVKPKRWRNR